jgi:hypothetical protein
MSSVVLVRPPYVECCPCFTSTPSTLYASSPCVIYCVHCQSTPSPSSSSPAGIAHPPPGSTPCIGSFRAGAGRCSPPALLTLVPFALVWADARPSALLAFAPSALVRADARPPRTSCIGSFGAGAGRCSPTRSLHRLVSRWCGQTLSGFFFFAASSAASCVCVYYCRTYYKAVRVGEEDSGGHVL